MSDSPRLKISRAAILGAVASLAAATPVAAHEGGHGTALAHSDSTATLGDCWLTVAYVPRPASALEKAFPTPPDLSQTFYGPDPLLGVWAMSCDHSRVAGMRAGPVIVSIVGVPVGLSVFGAPPLANFLSHALIRIDTDSRLLARALRHAGLRTGFRPPARYRHSPRGQVPTRGSFAIPDRYGVRVRASEPDPTNPHDHANRFDFSGRRARLATLRLSAEDAYDRFCFPAAGSCRASVRAARRSAMARLLGAASATARAGFDHARLGRVDLRAASPPSGP